MISVWDFFELGLLSFAIGHVCYTVAFGFSPRDYKKLAIGSIAGVLCYGYIFPGLNGKESLLRDLGLVLLPKFKTLTTDSFVMTTCKDWSILKF